jgi:asparagine synthase (glutamine-hydrolysing)
LKTAIEKQLIADVEVGSFLSGGLDSSSVVAMVNSFTATDHHQLWI